LILNQNPNFARYPKEKTILQGVFLKKKMGGATVVTPPTEESTRLIRKLLIGDVFFLSVAFSLKPLVPFFLGAVNSLTIFLIIFLYSSL
jgi:hypothetical protein